MDTIPVPNTVKVLNGTVSHGECESCPNKDCKITKTGSIWMCDECIDKDTKAALAHQTPEKQEERLQGHKNVEAVLMQQIRDENSRLKVSADIFNAKIKSIDALKAEIDASPDENKNFTLARVLAERFAHLNNLLHEVRVQTTEYETEQRAIQTYYNDLSKKLREEERKKIQLADMTYKPAIVPVKVKKETPKKKYDKTGIAAASQLSGIPEQLIQMVCVARDITPEAAVMILKEQGLGKK